MSLSSKP
jgi:hypothetical protein